MATLNNPGPYDCLAKLQWKPDMPFFVLLASDPIAADLVREWAYRAKLAGVNPEKVAEAERCAMQIDDWHNENVTAAPV